MYIYIFLSIFALLVSCNNNQKKLKGYYFESAIVISTMKNQDKICTDLHFQRKQIEDGCFLKEHDLNFTKNKAIALNAKIKKYCNNGFSNCCLSEFIYKSNIAYLKKVRTNNRLYQLTYNLLDINIVYNEIKNSNILIFDYINHLSATIHDGTFEGFALKLINNKDVIKFSNKLIKYYCKHNTFVCEYFYSSFHGVLLGKFLPETTEDKVLQILTKACFRDYSKRNFFCTSASELYRTFHKIENLSKKQNEYSVGLLREYFNLLYRSCMLKQDDCTNLRDLCIKLDENKHPLLKDDKIGKSCKDFNYIHELEDWQCYNEIHTQTPGD